MQENTVWSENTKGSENANKFSVDINTYRKDCAKTDNKHESNLEKGGIAPRLSPPDGRRKFDPRSPNSLERQRPPSNTNHNVSLDPIKYYLV